VAEETEGQDTGAEAVAGGADPAAVALALGGASREVPDAFLKKPGALIEDRRHHPRRQFTQLDRIIWQQRFGVLLSVYPHDGFGGEARTRNETATAQT
jgi:hypothetical protein